MAPADTTTPSGAPADTATDGDGTAPVAVAARSSRRATVKIVLAAVLVALLWPLMWSAGEGSTDALLGAGVEGPARERIEQDIPDLFELRGIGHDGQQFYVIARHPFDPDAAGDSVDPHAYRYRRILFPLAARVVAPGGGRATIGAFLALSLVGVALGAWAL
ncbi:MAG TPA: hypothetical protein VK507_06645, partial [Iamia sp.]|nr:hypothetical protein [Iamia sp.]